MSLRFFYRFDLLQTLFTPPHGIGQHFSNLVQMPPMQYLTHWPMTRANKRFHSGNSSVAQVAEASGYRSEVAFSATDLERREDAAGIGDARAARLKLQVVERISQPGGRSAAP